MGGVRREKSGVPRGSGVPKVCRRGCGVMVAPKRRGGGVRVGVGCAVKGATGGEMQSYRGGMHGRPQPRTQNHDRDGSL